MPGATADLDHADSVSPELSFPLLNDFQQLHEVRASQLQREATGHRPHANTEQAVPHRFGWTIPARWTAPVHRSGCPSGRPDLILPGAGDVEVVLPPGSLEVPLERAPSGHLLIVIDQFDKIKANRGGVPGPSIQLHTEGLQESTGEGAHIAPQMGHLGMRVPHPRCGSIPSEGGALTRRPHPQCPRNVMRPSLLTQEVFVQHPWEGCRHHRTDQRQCLCSTSGAAANGTRLCRTPTSTASEGGPSARGGGKNLKVGLAVVVGVPGRRVASAHCMLTGHARCRLSGPGRSFRHCVN